ncbi:GNAT family N-acetyltransferase [Paracoccus saliphilus]|uniref:Acetyltransferase (GNAT) family protein n=1 Tax=Paracoccus saliphilus TaxID=405559 RepID=A0AA46A5H0_9RHOB|nr:GNAT family N-acetyltransferase [Paracoccus saliphilus]WCR04238.1 GNAT family N-acetyltransferase [Paracoccus saliphilus]SIS80644.1 Acetyltransferase (GNAT) family protein [Paracoccus saliphilus]
MKICAPVPDAVLPQAVSLWRSAFGGREAAIPARAENAIAVMRGEVIEGIVGLRDDRGGFLAVTPPLMRLLFRPAPPTADLVLDGIVVRQSRRGFGRALVAAAEAEARRRRRHGLRAEVRLRDRGAVAFYRSLGFVEETRGRYGWPWSGKVAVMRKPV